MRMPCRCRRGIGTSSVLRDRHATPKEPLKLDPRPDTVPVYARAGAIVPMQPLVQHTGEQPDGPLQLQVYLPAAGEGGCAGSLYQDDGISEAFRQGAFLRIGYACEVSRRGAAINAHVAHDAYAPWWRDVELTLFGVERKPSSMRIDGQPVADWRYEAQARKLVATVRNGATRLARGSVVLISAAVSFSSFAGEKEPEGRLLSY